MCQATISLIRRGTTIAAQRNARERFFCLSVLIGRVADGGRWNCSPKFQPCGLLDEDVVLHHHHGDCNLRPSKCQRAFDMWKPVYEHAMQRNIGGIREWIGDVRNKWLPSLRSEGKLS